MKRHLVLIAGVVCYAIGMASLVALAAFVGNFGLSRALDSAPVSPIGQALATNLSLIALFGLQHSVMARPRFKRAWTRVVPQPLERGVYVLASALAVFALVGFWQPLGGTIWNLQSQTARHSAYALYGLGWVGVVTTTFLINHFDLFGLRQVWLHWRGREIAPVAFKTPGPYKIVRHPLYVGWLTVFWATPTMTISHLLLSLGMTAYILLAIRFEERDLAEFHGEAYENYRKTVPMLIPNLGGAKISDATDESVQAA